MNSSVMLLLPCGGHNMALGRPLPPERFESEMPPSLFLSRCLVTLLCATAAAPVMAQEQFPTVLGCTGPLRP
jgi:hypothetical protein